MQPLVQVDNTQWCGMERTVSILEPHLKAHEPQSIICMYAHAYPVAHWQAGGTVILEINAVILLVRTLRVIFWAHLNENIY